MTRGWEKRMTHDIPEADWRVFRELRELALDRFCKRVLDEVERMRQDSSRSHHARYLDIFRLLRERDKELAEAFNDPGRSRMLWQLIAISRCGLLEPGELSRFTSKTRERFESLAREIPDP
jgi:hypothetical protein